MRAHRKYQWPETKYQLLHLPADWQSKGYEYNASCERTQTLCAHSLSFSGRHSRLPGDAGACRGNREAQGQNPLPRLVRPGRTAAPLLCSTPGGASADSGRRFSGGGGPGSPRRHRRWVTPAVRRRWPRAGSVVLAPPGHAHVVKRNAWTIYSADGVSRRPCCSRLAAYALALLGGRPPKCGRICWMFDEGTFKCSDFVRGSAYAKCTMAGRRSCNVQWLYISDRSL